VSITARDEQAHEPGPGDWQEHWHVELVTPIGLALYARLTVWPSEQTAWWWTAVVVPDAPGPVLVRATDLAPPRAGALAVRGEGVWAELVCETPLEHWTIGLEAFGVRLDDPLDALRDERGERIAVGIDLEWETSGAPERVDRGYAQPGTVHGDLLLGALTIPIDTVGTRMHEWGPAPWSSQRDARAHAVDPETRLLVSASGRGELVADGLVTLLVDAPPVALHRAVTTIESPSGTPVRGWAEWHDAL